MTKRAEIERLLQMTGRTLEGLPEYYPEDQQEKLYREVIEKRELWEDRVLHQSDVIELLVGALRDALTERNAALAKVPRWISVKDELPPKHLRVLLMNGHRMVASGHLTYVKAKCGTSLWCMDGVNRNDVTHWAKLPEPPEEGE